jgi:tetratricopeptide (TPR) repeat protein
LKSYGNADLNTIFRIGSISKSYAFFNLNIKNYPESANVYDSMADYYEKQNDFVSALKNVTKAYEISHSDIHKSRIEKLKKQ